jgi:hypothetical protein
VTLTLDRGDPRSPQLVELTTEHVPIRTETTKFDLDVEARELTAGLLLTMTYSTALFDRSTMQQALEYFSAFAVLLQIIQRKSIPSLARRSRNAAESRPSTGPIARIHRRLHPASSQTRSPSRAVAVCSNGSSIMIDRPAHTLCRGRHPESLIGVMERSQR